MHQKYLVKLQGCFYKHCRGKEWQRIPLPEHKPMLILQYRGESH